MKIIRESKQKLYIYRGGKFSYFPYLKLKDRILCKDFYYIKMESTNYKYQLSALFHLDDIYEYVFEYLKYAELCRNNIHKKNEDFDYMRISDGR